MWSAQSTNLPFRFLILRVSMVLEWYDAQFSISLQVCIFYIGKAINSVFAKHAHQLLVCDELFPHVVPDRPAVVDDRDRIGISEAFNSPKAKSQPIEAIVPEHNREDQH